MERWQNRVAVVTGAGCGIGAAIAKDLVGAGLLVVGLDRAFEGLEENRMRLPEAQQSRYFVRKCDVTEEIEVKAAFEWVERTLGGTDILVNNAGVLYSGNLVEMDSAALDEVLDTNVKGLVYCTQAAYRSMKKRDFQGHIIHLNSVAGHEVVTFGPNSLNMYPPSKHAVTAINTTLRNELSNLGTRIKTTSISPGVVRTPMATGEVLKRFEKPMDTEDVSQAVLFAIATPPHVQIHEMIFRPFEL